MGQNLAYFASEKGNSDHLKTKEIDLKSVQVFAAIIKPKINAKLASPKRNSIRNCLLPCAYKIEFSTKSGENREREREERTNLDLHIMGYVWFIKKNNNGLRMRYNLMDFSRKMWCKSSLCLVG